MPDLSGGWREVSKELNTEEGQTHQTKKDSDKRNSRLESLTYAADFYAREMKKKSIRDEIRDVQRTLASERDNGKHLIVANLPEDFPEQIELVASYNEGEDTVYISRDWLETYQEEMDSLRLHIEEYGSAELHSRLQEENVDAQVGIPEEVRLECYEALDESLEDPNYEDWNRFGSFYIPPVEPVDV